MTESGIGESAGAASGRSIRRLFTDSGAGIASQAAALAVVLVLTPLELASMGSERYAIVALASASASYVSLVDLGGGWALMRFIPLFSSQGDDEAANQAFSAALVLSAIAGLVGGAAVWLLARSVAPVFHTSRSELPNAVWALRLGGAALPALLISGVLAGAVRALGRFKVAAAVSAASVAGFNGIWVAIARAHGSPAAVIAAQWFIDCLLIATWLTILHRDDKSPHLQWPIRTRAAWELASFSLLNSVGQLGLTLLMTVDKIVVSSAVGAASLVYYAIPFSLAQRITVICSNVAAVVFPKFSERRSSNRSAAEELLTVGPSIVIVATFAMGSAVAWEGRSLLAIWISPAFAAHSSTPLAILAIGFSLVSWSSLYHVNLEATGHIAKTTMVTVACGAIGIGSCLILARQAGLVGGALGISLGLALLAAAIIEMSRRLESVPNRRQLVWTAKVGFVLFGIGCLAHLAVGITISTPSIRYVADVLATSSVLFLLAMTFVRQAVGRRHALD